MKQYAKSIIELHNTLVNFGDDLIKLHKWPIVDCDNAFIIGDEHIMVPSHDVEIEWKLTNVPQIQRHTLSPIEYALCTIFLVNVTLKNFAEIINSITQDHIYSSYRNASFERSLHSINQGN